MKETIFYHGLPQSKVDSVMESGLIIEKARGDRQLIYLTSCKQTAENYCFMRKLNPEDWAVVGVKSSSLDLDCITPDYVELSGLADGPDVLDPDQFENWGKAPAWVSLNIPSQIAYSKNIAATDIMLFSDSLLECC